MAKAQLEKELDERDLRIIDATVELVEELGYDKVRLIDIADRSGASVGSLQHRYRTREGLMRTVVEKIAWTDLPSFQEIASEIPDPYERLVVLIEHSFLRFASDRPSGYPRRPSPLLWFELTIVSARDEELRRILGDAERDWRRCFRDALAEGFASGRFESALDPAQVETALMAIFDGLALERIVERESTPLEDFAGLATAVLRSLIDLKGSASREPRA